ncbi:MAG: SMC-Scp complex subunit ScpB [Lactobacillus sp.]|nr:SMC-Scp complex subunit ScpB [Lactobacillus sp.]MDN6042611.1 SMC-Scp complex subunit ScpB [Lactobacillus sp.]MDN6052327.1 SMC-Scp complex subunit ScpB [Lactobacillus sp.]
MTKQADLEALLYVAGDDGITTDNLAVLLEQSPAGVSALVTTVNQQLQQCQAGLKLIQLNDRYKMVTSDQVAGVITDYFQRDLSKYLSQSALEILSIIAYRQPITRIEVDEIRGVNSSGALQTLIWRGLVRQNGKKDAPGHPNLYITTDYFLQYFGYHDLSDLPDLGKFTDLEQAEEVTLFPDSPLDHTKEQNK